MRAWVLPCLLLACRAPVDLAKEPAFDFTAHPGPGAAAFSPEATLLSRWNDARPDSLRDFWNGGEAGSFAGVDGVDIVWRAHRVPNAKAAVVLIPGRTEAIIKYAELAHDLNAQGYSTFAVTLRGQGEAGRMLADREKGYVVWFHDYVADTHAFIQSVVRKEGLKVFALAHSTGGAVAVSLADEFPADLDALATTSSMLQVNLGAFPPPVAATLADGVCGASDGTGYTLGAGPYVEETDFPNNSVTQSQARFTWKVQQLHDDASLRLGGVTWRWLCQALVGSGHATGLGKYSAMPTLMFQAGKDSIVKPAAQTKYCSEAPRCTLVVEPDSKHEQLQETDAIRGDVLTKIVAFFDVEASR